MFRSTFSEWYSPDEQTIADIISNGTIALDTNVLLGLYRISAEARQDLLDLLRHDRIRPRLFIPYQVGLEYQRRRVSVANDQNIGYRSVRARIEKALSTLSDLAVKESDNEIRDSQVRDELNEAVRRAVKISNGALEKLTTKVESIQQTHVIADKQLSGSDPVRDAFEQLFADDGQVGTQPTPQELLERQKEATKRYESRIPPGYEDATGKNAKEDPSGDYLIWRELLDRAGAEPGPILFVTEDKKPDWYAQDKQKRILGPRVELRVEMAAVTAHPYHQTPLNSFLHLVDTHLGLALSRDTVEQVEEATTSRNIFVWNGDDSVPSHPAWTVPETAQSLARAQRIMDVSSPRRSPNRVELLAAINRLSTNPSLDDSSVNALISLREEIVSGTRIYEDLANEMKATRDWENYDAVRDPSAEGASPNLNLD
ncbi:hypothetical protein CH253_17830 [Rhodococcus sp. 06-156-3C]|uniref:PIN-like domain-containing protein n=1 Tax=Nocardiaceae TaxID=85025 RepID=UPI00068C1836|nr:MULTISPECIES: PIN domain-containing protein [Rhodococcus]OZD18322.1 hypothetical protein CH280_07155 [Rhodococcus sp. 06-156-4C]OZD18920.1 hypothetical protein CH253_17830 [Rhodococcus sp. 06-156-3C]OZD22430.1 hypothetical protein CH248_09415 [Rhodococcus sp. 06-156-4a]OZD34014.1 hypothetical protein CH247_07945 [Rhodococcus sp. 06-156-3b]OZD38751.1 hypothetical protein CH284_06365 [Rhodococcus sp. 06-156-3]